MTESVPVGHPSTNSMRDGQGFSFRESRWSFLSNALKYRFHNYFSRNSSPLFLRGGDRISTWPIISGSYEKEIASLIRFLSASGCSDALIDIGANIGLMTFYTRPFFDRAYCFEPNQRVFSVLTANLFDFRGPKTQLFNFGLGAKDEKCTLHIPKANYGGAFVFHSANSYSMQELAEKDGFTEFEQANYDTLQVDIRSGREELSRIFSECKNGVVVKIDVEGFEQTILKEIAAALPENLSIAIIFENWSKTFSPHLFVRETFKRPMQVSKLSSTVDPQSRLLTKLWNSLRHGRIFYVDTSPQSWIGTIVFSSFELKRLR